VAALLIGSVAHGQIVKWRVLDDGDPRERDYFDMVYDSARDRVVVFGGRSQGSVFNFADTWEFDGTDWMNRRPAVAPGPREGHSMAFMASTGLTVLFGGTQFSALLDETWVYDGLKWRQLFPATSPPARMYAAMVYDENRDRIVLFGGADVSGNFDDTWEFDGSTWYEVATSVQPPPRRNHDMVFDSANSRVLLYGGYIPNTLDYHDTWEYCDGMLAKITTTTVTSKSRAVV
jgi:hypothetical protein